MDEQRYAYVPPELGLRPPEDIARAYSIAVEVWNANTETPAAPWCGGVVATLSWILGFEDTSPMSATSEPLARTRENLIGLSLNASGTVYSAKPRAISRSWARGVMKTLDYVLGTTDDLPVRPEPRNHAA